MTPEAKAALAREHIKRRKSQALIAHVEKLVTKLNAAIRRNHEMAVTLGKRLRVKT